MAADELYQNINPDSLSSAASELLSKLNKYRNSLSSFKLGLNEGIWKANARKTLITALDQIDNIVYENLNTQLSKALRIAELVELYKKSLATVQKNEKKLQSWEYRLNHFATTEDVAALKAQISNCKAAIRACKVIMENSKNSINSLCS